MSYHSQQDYTADSPYILTGYRDLNRCKNSIKECLTTALLEWNNQTINTWTALLYAIMNIYMVIEFGGGCKLLYLHATTRSLCWIASALYHSLNAYSSDVAHILCKIDYMGCILSIIGMGSTILLILATTPQISQLMNTIYIWLLMTGLIFNLYHMFYFWNLNYSSNEKMKNEKENNMNNNNNTNNNNNINEQQDRAIIMAMGTVPYMIGIMLQVFLPGNESGNESGIGNGNSMFTGQNEWVFLAMAIVYELMMYFHKISWHWFLAQYIVASLAMMTHCIYYLFKKINCCLLTPC